MKRNIFLSAQKSSVGQKARKLLKQSLAAPLSSIRLSGRFVNLGPALALVAFILLASPLAVKAGGASLDSLNRLKTAAEYTADFDTPRIIPEPAFLQIQDGRASYPMDPASGYQFKLVRGSKKGGAGQKLNKKQTRAVQPLLDLMGRELASGLSSAAGNSSRQTRAGKIQEIILNLNPDLDFDRLTTDKERKTPEAQPLSLNEAYQLSISMSGISIAARTQTGLYYGLQSLLQIIEQYKLSEGASTSVKILQIPLMEVQDAPVYSWRGFMLDVSRHFYSVTEIKKLLDLMSRYKLNIFHWHLTDDQGWRLQIKRYPKLTAVGAWREEIPGSVFFNKRPDTVKGTPYRYGGFYTQEEARDIVQYAALRGITVVPEIELPGHSAAALAAYPEYSASGKPQTVPNSMGYGKGAVSEYNPGNPATFTFLEHILKEVMDIFPSTYIHIGGDEVDKTNWKQNPSCKTLMEKEGLKDYEALQSYFINKIGRFLAQHGRKMIGWDEALEGDLLHSATITYWRSYAKKAPLKAVSEGHGFINVRSDPFYFNRYQAGPAGEPLAAPHSMNTLERVYRYQIMPEGFTEDQQKLVKGGQAAIWTEFFSDPKGLEYMLLPRLLALSENLWTQDKHKDYKAFYGALPRALHVLEKKGYNYRRLDK